MRRGHIAVLLVLLVPGLAPGARAGQLHAAYEIYAAGFGVAELQADFGLTPREYQIRLAYHTTGLAGFFYSGHQLNTVDGTWRAGEPIPREFYGIGRWHGENREAIIDYAGGRPFIRALIPPNSTEREPVPPDIQANSVDTLSALALLMRRVRETGRCEAAVHTYDGRRATELEARTVGMEVLPRTGRSIYSGPALRCDFEGRMLAGFRFGDDTPADRRPMHGSAWFADPVPGAEPLPVRMQFETRWFGDATMYLTSAAPAGAARPADGARP